MTAHVALLGDSIFDNGTYTSGEPDVCSHLRSLLPEGFRASLFAVDGSPTGDLAGQLLRVPSDVTHLVVSLGGNDALLNSDMVNAAVSSASAALELFSDRLVRFEASYRAAIEAAAAMGRDLTTCTIYNANLEPELAPAFRVALMMFNDVILRVAFERRLSVIDLRLVCTTPADYANRIEPSGSGGLKIARAIVRRLGIGGADSAHARVFW